MNIKISADSTCDLPRELAQKWDISILPLYVVKDGKSYRDGVDITPRDIFAYADETGKNCSTAAVTVADYSEFFAAQLREHDAVIHFHISSGMSACCQNALIASEGMENVYCIDTANLSSGIALMALDACEMARSGMAACDIAEAVRAKTGNVDSSFLVDTLVYLRRGGRCSALAALGANILSLKPCINVVNGEMTVGKKYRGDIEKCLIRYIDDRLRGRCDLDLRRIFITGSGGFDGAFLNSLKDEVLSIAPFEEVCFSDAGGTISSHCGPKTLGILFMTK